MKKLILSSACAIAMMTSHASNAANTYLTALLINTNPVVETALTTDISVNQRTPKLTGEFMPTIESGRTGVQLAGYFKLSGFEKDVSYKVGDLTASGADRTGYCSDSTCLSFDGDTAFSIARNPVFVSDGVTATFLKVYHNAVKPLVGITHLVIPVTSYSA
ncbi:hypothetical protein IB305_005047 [Salmonella enterica]|nr:hypothetical protein [Salmonella enterica]